MSGLVLLVEDDSFLLWILEETLHDCGYRTWPNMTGRAGIAAVESGQPYDALVTDIRLADGPCGWEIARHARLHMPAVPVLYISGDSAIEHPKEGVMNSKMLAKPFQPEALATALALIMLGG